MDPKTVELFSQFFTENGLIETKEVFFKEIGDKLKRNERMKRVDEVSEQLLLLGSQGNRRGFEYAKLSMDGLDKISEGNAGDLSKSDVIIDGLVSAVIGYFEEGIEKADKENSFLKDGDCVGVMEEIITEEVVNEESSIPQTDEVKESLTPEKEEIEKELGSIKRNGRLSKSEDNSVRSNDGKELEHEVDFIRRSSQEMAKNDQMRDPGEIEIRKRKKDIVFPEVVLKFGEVEERINIEDEWSEDDDIGYRLVRAIPGLDDVYNYAEDEEEYPDQNRETFRPNEESGEGDRFKDDSFDEYESEEEEDVKDFEDEDQEERTQDSLMMERRRMGINKELFNNSVETLNDSEIMLMNTSDEEEDQDERLMKYPEGEYSIDNERSDEEEEDSELYTDGSRVTENGSILLEENSYINDVDEREEEEEEEEKEEEEEEEEQKEQKEEEKEERIDVKFGVEESGEILVALKSSSNKEEDDPEKQDSEEADDDIIEFIDDEEEEEPKKQEGEEEEEGKPAFVPPKPDQLSPIAKAGLPPKDDVVEQLNHLKSRVYRGLDEEDPGEREELSDDELEFMGYGDDEEDEDEEERRVVVEEEEEEGEELVDIEEEQEIAFLKRQERKRILDSLSDPGRRSESDDEEEEGEEEEEEEEGELEFENELERSFFEYYLNPKKRKAPREELRMFMLPIIYESNKTGFEEKKEFPIRINEVVAGRYQIVDYIGSAAFSRAVRAFDLKEERDVCLKIIKNNKDFFDQSIDEIKLLTLLKEKAGDGTDHNIVQLYDSFYYKEHLFLVFELLHDNLYEFWKLVDKQKIDYFTKDVLQKITKQLLDGLKYLHGMGLIHCDLKPENILIKDQDKHLVKIIDFGSSCYTYDHLCAYIQSRTYRAPEVVLGLPYDQKIDIWSLGCIIYELFTGNVLFSNDSIQAMLAKIVGVCGKIDEEMMCRGKFVGKFFTKDLTRIYQKPDLEEGERYIHFLIPKKTTLWHRLKKKTKDRVFVDFLEKCLIINPRKRMSVEEALQHPFVTSLEDQDGLH